MILYHGSNEIVEYPEIRKAKFNKDFYFGFYCTKYPEQAERWACLLYTSPSPRDGLLSRMPSSA